MEEIWKDIPGYEGLYQVSNLGRVKNKDGHILYIRRQNAGYYLVHLYKNNKRKAITVHRLVAKAFVSNVNNGTEVNHIDGIRSNNSANNLEWVSPSDNQRHSRFVLGNICGNAPKKVICVESGVTYQSSGEASLSTGVNKYSIYLVASKKKGRKTAGGYHWEYVD